MSKKMILGGVAIILLIPLLWYFISPLFIDNEVNEALPFEIPPEQNVQAQEDQPQVIQEESNVPSETGTQEAESQEEVDVHIVEEQVEEDPAVSEPVLTHQGTFEKIDYSVEGGFKVYEHEGKRLLRIEDLDISNGPDLHLVFANKWGSFVREYELVHGEKLTGEKLPNKGSYNVEIPDDLDPDDFQYLLIHCVRFTHTFAGASIERV